MVVGNRVPRVTAASPREATAALTVRCFAWRGSHRDFVRSPLRPTEAHTTIRREVVISLSVVLGYLCWCGAQQGPSCRWSDGFAGGTHGDSRSVVACCGKQSTLCHHVRSLPSQGQRCGAPQPVWARGPRRTSVAPLRAQLYRALATASGLCELVSAPPCVIVSWNSAGIWFACGGSHACVFTRLRLLHCVRWSPQVLLEEIDAKYANKVRRRAGDCRRRAGLPS